MKFLLIAIIFALTASVASAAEIVELKYPWDFQGQRLELTLKIDEDSNIMVENLPFNAQFVYVPRQAAMYFTPASKKAVYVFNFGTISRMLPISSAQRVAGDYKFQEQRADFWRVYAGSEICHYVIGSTYAAGDLGVNITDLSRLIRILDEIFAQTDAGLCATYQIEPGLGQLIGFPVNIRGRRDSVHHGINLIKGETEDFEPNTSSAQMWDDKIHAALLKQLLPTEQRQIFDQASLNLPASQQLAALRALLHQVRDNPF